MAAWRILASVALTLWAVRTGSAETYALIETPQVGDCFQYQLQMTLAGEIRVRKGNKPVALKLAATAEHSFPERILAIAATGMLQKTARVYDNAKAVITVAGDRSERLLRPERRLLVAQRSRDQLLLYCPAGPLTREELELTSEHFDTLSLTGLLPNKAVAGGGRWSLANNVVQSLCNFEGLTGQDLTCKLERVVHNIARISVAGTASGIDVGALVKLKISATCDYDLQHHCLVGLQWQQQDDRDQGPASPASTVKSTTIVKRTPIDQPKILNDIALISVPDGLGDPPLTMTQLFYRDPKSRYELLYARGWQVVAETPEHFIMRFMDRGDLVAQVTITPWTPAKPGEHMSPEEFQEAMTGTPGWEQGEVLQTGVVSQEGGKWIYRLSTLGRMDGLNLLQNFYLVAGPNGQQLVLAFTMTQGQAEKLGSRDLTLAASIEFPKQQPNP